MADPLGELQEYDSALKEGDYEAATVAFRQRVPLHNLMQLTILRRESGVAVLTMELSDEVRGMANGSVHGGMLATFADVASASSLYGSYDLETEIPVTTDMHVRYYRQPRSGPLTAEARVVHQGRRLLSTECLITDTDQRVLSRSTATYMIVPLKT